MLDTTLTHGRRPGKGCAVVQRTNPPAYKPHEMAAYPTVNPRAFGTTIAVPRAIARLPYDLLRTSLVTRDPAAVKTAMQEYREAMAAENFQPATTLPQRMMWQQNKVGGGAIHRGDPREALSSASTLMAAASSRGAMVPGLSAVGTVQMRMPERVPTYSEAAAAAARGAQAFPQPEIGPAPAGLPVRVRPDRQRIAPPMEAFGEEQRASQQHAAAQAAYGATRALQAVELAKQSLRARLGIR